MFIDIFCFLVGGNFFANNDSIVYSSFLSLAVLENSFVDFISNFRSFDETEMGLEYKIFSVFRQENEEDVYMMACWKH